MKVLVLEAREGLAAPVVDELAGHGHTVLRCDSTNHAEGAACRGLESDGACPLDADDVSVTVVSHAGDTLAPSEHGALCASRQRIPVVVVGATDAQPFGPGVWAAGDDLLATCEEAANSGMAHVAAVRRDLATLGLLDADDRSVGVEVVREPRRLVLTLQMAEDHPRGAAITKAAAEALRRFDAAAAVIDVRVTH